MSQGTSYNLAAFDLNLLVAFDALMRERSVSRAASRVGMSQPGMSNALRRMREIFNDELFVRSSEGMVPSGTARVLAETICPGLSQIRSGLQSKMFFDPAETTRRFVLGNTDGGSMFGFPRLARSLVKEAQFASFHVVDIGSGDLLNRLLAGEMDMAFGVSRIGHPNISYLSLAEFSYVVIADRDNELLRGRALTIEDIARLPHVAFAGSAVEDRIDETLARHGLERRIAVRLPHLWAVPSLVAGSDMIAIIESAVVDLSPDARDRIVMFDDPLGLPPCSTGIMWNTRNDDDPAHRWLRRKILELVARDAGKPRMDRIGRLSTSDDGLAPAVPYDFDTPMNVWRPVGGWEKPEAE